MRQLSETVNPLNLGVATVYVIRDAHSLTLFDAGGVDGPPRLTRHLARLGLRPRDLDRIIVSHAHYDHAGGVAELHAQSGAQVWAHADDRPFLERGVQAPLADPATLTAAQRAAGFVLRGEMPATPVHRSVSGGEVLSEVAGRPRVVHLPGHSPGMIGLWWPQDGVLLGGDVATHFLPWRLTPPVAAYTPDPAEAARSVVRAARLGPQVLGLGHGPVIHAGAAPQLWRLARQLGADVAVA